MTPETETILSQRRGKVKRVLPDYTKPWRRHKVEDLGQFNKTFTFVTYSSSKISRIPSIALPCSALKMYWRILLWQ
jgi:hypothetical protein